MDVEKVLCMVGSTSETSYAANSTIPVGTIFWQLKALLRIRPMLQEAVSEIYRNLHPEKMTVADLGCSIFWPKHTPLVVRSDKNYQQSMFENRKTAARDAVLLISTTSFSRSTELRRVRVEKGAISVPYFVAGLPGSFYRWLLPRQSVHVFHSTFSLQWISQGLVEGENVDTFNLPFYTPSAEEVEAIINLQGLFDIIHFQTLESNLDPFHNLDDDVVLDNVQSGANCAKAIRSVIESMIASHFGSTIVDDLFSRLGEKGTDINKVISFLNNAR